VLSPLTGAHEEIYRIVQYPTSKNRADPDRVWFNTSEIDPAIRQVKSSSGNQPPWYYGNNNKTRPADTNYETVGNRYGYRGGRAIRQRETKLVEPPERTTTPFTPKFLIPKEHITDEWVPTAHRADLRWLRLPWWQ
jgi:hypothetical protein